MPAALCGGLGLYACVVQERCSQDRDCAEGRCDEASGACEAHECVEDSDCGGFPFTCDYNHCVVTCDEEPWSCPADMVPACGAFCIDSWEASRPDATATEPGIDESLAVSQPGVLPWYSSDNMGQDIAAAACAAAGKRLCTPQEWGLICATTDEWSYSYGDDYEPATCNGMDTFCDCDGDGEPDGDEVYPHCHQVCGADLQVMPTGSFSDCTNGFGAHDITGNVWEIVATDDGIDHYRGGAYNCNDSESLHRCDYDAAASGGFPSARGFRCCADGEPIE